MDHRLFNQGLSGLDDTPNLDHPATLSTAQQAKLKAFVQHQSLSEQGGQVDGQGCRPFYPD